MIKNFFPILALFALWILAGCWSANWSEKEIDEFRQNCERQLTFISDPICFVGFDSLDLSSSFVLEKNGEEVIDTLFISFEPPITKSDKERKIAWGNPNATFDVQHSYSFYLGKDKPYLLDNMKMILWAQNTMSGENWACKMGEFTIDDKKFTKQGNIIFTKRSSH